MARVFKKLIGLLLLINLSACSELEDDRPETVIVAGEEMCAATDANRQLFNYMNEWYFWNQDLPANFSPESYATIPAALDSLKSDLDRFSFSLTQEDYADFVNARYVGYGISSQVNEEKNGLKIRIVFQDSSAYEAGLRRGDVIDSIEGVRVAEWLSQIEAGQLTWNDVLGADEEGASIAIEFSKPSGEQLTGTITKRSVNTETVLHSEVRTHNETTVGYLVFNSFKEISKSELKSAFRTFSNNQVTELVLDLRYNGGGLNDVANQLASQIAGQQVAGKKFTEMVFNRDKQDENRSLYFQDMAANERLDLQRVYILQTISTCSASELVINALSPFIEVVTIGSTSCGKPIGMYPTPICDDVVFAINFQTVNAEGFGDYFTGLTATCDVNDAILGDWDQIDDPLYQAAVNYMQTGQCPTSTGDSLPPSLRPVPSQPRPVPADWDVSPLATPETSGVSPLKR